MCIDTWANFLMNEKLHAERVEEKWVMELVRLCEELAKIRPPKISMHKFKLESRQLVCNTAMNLGIDLPAIRSRTTGKFIIGRGLLDMWNAVCEMRFGSAKGTASMREATRRNVVTRLSKDD